MRRVGLSLLLVAVLSGEMPAEAADDADERPALTIGVLSYRGGDMAERTWGRTADYLNDTLAGFRFRLRALSLEVLTAAAVAGKVDFIITNPGHSFQLVRRTGASRVATARTLATDDQTRALGSAIVSRLDGPIDSLKALRGHSVGIVAEDAFGGHLLASYRLRRVLGDESAVNFRVIGFPHQAIIGAVLDGTVDAGVVRACLIESMISAGTLLPARIRVLDPQPAVRFSCQASTDLYPGWAFLKLPQVSPEVATEVTRALLAMPHMPGGDPWLGHDGWIAPVSYAAVEGVYRELGLYPYAQDLAGQLRHWVRENRAWVAVGAMLIGLFLLHIGYVEILVRRRTRQLEAASRHARHLEGELAHAERVSSMSILAASLAHDLNQPLAAISTFAHGLLLRHRRGTADGEVTEATLQRISEQANRASAFIRSMRGFLTKEPEHRVVLDLRDLLDEVVMLMATHAQKNDCRLEWQRPATAAPVEADGVQLRQVAVALVQNAIDASPDGGEVTLQLAREDGRCLLSVADRGAGLSEEARAHAFEPFFSTKSGLGLGLATASSIMERHDGSLDLEPRPGGGTVARAVLPEAPQATGDPT